MTALWTSNGGEFDHRRGDGFANGDDGNGWGCGLGFRHHGNDNDDSDYDGNGNGYGGSNGSSRGDQSGDGYPEQAYDGCTAISHLQIREAKLPIADLLTIAVAR